MPSDHAFKLERLKKKIYIKEYHVMLHLVLIYIINVKEQLKKTVVIMLLVFF